MTATPSKPPSIPKRRKARPVRKPPVTDGTSAPSAAAVCPANPLRITLNAKPGTKLNLGAGKEVAGAGGGPGHLDARVTRFRQPTFRNQRMVPNVVENKQRTMPTGHSRDQWRAGFWPSVGPPHDSKAIARGPIRECLRMRTSSTHGSECSIAGDCRDSPRRCFA